MRTSTKVFLIILAVPVAFLGYQWVSLSHHSREVTRLSDLIRLARDVPPAGVDQSSWNLVNEGPYMFVANFMVQRSRCPTEKVTAVADQFAAKWPQGARSTADLRAMMALLEATLPQYKDHQTWMETLGSEMEEIDKKLAAARQK